MTTLQELRESLADHASDVDAGLAADRAGSVRHRVGVVRRRRRAAIAGVAAVAVVASVAGIVRLGPATRPAPAAPVVLDVRAPETLRALGYTYRAEPKATAYDGQGRLRLPASDRPRLVSWVADEADTVRVKVPWEQARTSGDVHFGDFSYVPPGIATTVAVSVDRGRVGVVTYDLTDKPPAGYTKDGITFRDHVAENTLQAAAIGDEGQADLALTFPMPDATVAAALSCTGLPKGLMVRIETPQDSDHATSCGGPKAEIFDPGRDASFRYDSGLGVATGDPVTVRVRVVEMGGKESVVPASEVPHVRIAVGFYALGPSVRVAGWDMPRVVEEDGHLWRRAGHAVGRDGAEVRARGAGPHLVSIPFLIHRQSGFRVALDGRPSAGTELSAPGRAMFGPRLVGSGPHTVSVRATRPSPGDRVGLVVYDLAD